MSKHIRKKEGFKGQVQHVIPRQILDTYVHHHLLNQLLATDIGWYPHAQYHYRERPNGAAEHILIFCIGGEGWCIINEEKIEVKPKHALLIPQGKPHIYGADAAFPWSIQWVHVRGSTADYFFRLLAANEYVLPVSTDICDRMRETFEECYTAFVGSFAWQRMAQVTQSLQYLFGQLFFGNSQYSPVLRRSHPHNFEATLHYLNQNLDQPITLADIADHANLSPSYFSRLFREQTGFAPMEYFINLRVQHAAMLLDFTDMTVKEIGYEVGYDDPYYFSRVFKRVLGVSPSHYRKQTQGR